MDMQGKRVLIVEDEALLALEIGAMLQECGMTPVGPSSCSDDALRLIHGQLIDCAVLDVNLQGESTERIAAELAARAIPFVFVTGYSREDIPERFRTAPLVMKPFAPAKLLDTILAL